MLRKALIVATLLAVAHTLPATAQDKREFRLGPAAPPSHPSYSHLYIPFQKFLPDESGGRLTGKIYGMDVANLAGMKSALKSGLIEIGIILQPYFPSDLPEAVLTGELALSGRNPYAMAAAVTEYIVTCEPCQQEMRKLGGVFLTSGSTDVYVLITTKPVRTLGDMKGKRLRTSTPTFGRLATALGAVPVSLTANEVFEAMTQGTIDGTMSSAADLLSLRFMDIAKFVTDVQLGTFHTQSGFTVNSNVWKGLSIEDRKAIARAATKGTMIFTRDFGYDHPAKSRTAAAGAGIEFIKPDPQFTAFVEDFAQKDLAAAANVAATQYGVKDAAKKLERLAGLVKRWEKIAADLNNDPDAIGKAMQREIWDKVDFTTYGL